MNNYLFESNFNKFLNGKNILFVTGLSGSGKSTYAKFLVKTQYKNAIIVELDSYFENKPNDIFYMRYQEMLKNDDSIEDSFDSFVKSIMMEEEKYPDGIIIEGLQVYNNISPESIKDYPIVALTTFPEDCYKRLSTRGIANNNCFLDIDKLNNHYKLLSEFIDRIKTLNNNSNDILKEEASIKDSLLEILSEDIDLISNIEEYNGYINEEYISKSNIKPIFILLTANNTLLGNVIRKISHTKYNHASITFDLSLQEIYSYGRDQFSIKYKKGFSRENIDRYNELFNGESKYCLIALFTTKDLVEIARVNCKRYLMDIYNSKYSVLGLISYLLNKGLSSENSIKLFCSQFVDHILNKSNIDLFNGKSTGLIHPIDFYNTTNKRVYILEEGIMRDYNQKRLEKKLISAQKDFLKKFGNKYFEDNVINENLNVFDDTLGGNTQNTNNEALLKEAKSIPIELDASGNLKIKNFKKIDFSNEYFSSHKLLLQYHENKNIDGIKYEICKLWFMNSILENYIYKKYKDDNNKKEEYIKIRAKILNDFNKYLKVVLEFDKNFNFTSYYEETPFNDKELLISKYTLSGIFKMVKLLLTKKQ